MSARAEYFRQLARKCAAAADAAADPVTKAKFEQEHHQWLLRAEQAVKTERNLTTAVTSAGRALVRPLPVIKGPSAAWLSAVERLVDREGRRDSARPSTWPL